MKNKIISHAKNYKKTDDLIPRKNVINVRTDGQYPILRLRVWPMKKGGALHFPFLIEDSAAKSLKHRVINLCKANTRNVDFDTLDLIIRPEFTHSLMLNLLIITKNKSF